MNEPTPVTTIAITADSASSRSAKSTWKLPAWIQGHSATASALPAGITPFENNGTGVYYFQPRSVGLARALDHALVGEFGFRDLGIGRADMALTRPTWMPAALCEGLFLMLPDQEAVLASDAGQWRYARGIVEGLRDFLRQRAAR